MTDVALRVSGPDDGADTTTAMVNAVTFPVPGGIATTCAVIHSCGTPKVMVRSRRIAAVTVGLLSELLPTDPCGDNVMFAKETASLGGTVRVALHVPRPSVTVAVLWTVAARYAAVIVGAVIVGWLNAALHASTALAAVPITDARTVTWFCLATP